MPKINERDLYHPTFADMLQDYEMIRACFRGSRAVKEAGPKYLPKLTDQSESDYNMYKTRALFFPITGKTASTLVGLATSKKPNLTFEPSMKKYFEDSVYPNQFTEFLMEAMREIILQGRYGILIDAPPGNSTKLNLLPYFAENIINWQTDDTGQLIWVLLKEYQVVDDPDHRFKKKKLLRFRWCGLRNGQYTVEVLDDELKVVSSVVPTFRGKPSTFVPFFIVGASGVHAEPDQPPMLDIATINISHYMTSADLEWGRHFVGLPTPVVIGADAAQKLVIGGTAAWILPNPDAKAQYLEFQGQGLQSLENALKEKIGLMATMSARMVDTASKGSEAAETVRLRYMSETASLKQIIESAETMMNVVFNAVAQFEGVNTPTIELTKEIMATRLTAAELKELFTAYLSGAMPKKMFIYNLRRGEMIDPDQTDEEVESEIPNPPPIKEPNPPVGNNPVNMPQGN